MSTRPRRVVAALTATVVGAGLAVAATPSTANADYSKAITIVGTSDVFDSGLMQYLLPRYQKATGATYNYVSKGTGDAIAYAEAGTASVLMVHAASLENQFVAQGFSLEKYGRSVFWGDYVLAGPASDPAGVSADSHDIVGAFEKLAAAGTAGTANFVSRGNTAGTPVQEHALWALTGAGVTKCTISAVNGGGKVPSVSGADGANCNLAADLPVWYHKTGLTQGPNVTNASVCNYTGGNCYVFTDRGTLQYLQSTGQAQNLKILVRNNAATARGSEAALVNAFHAYAVNPKAAPAGNAISKAGARKFLNWLTSKAGQKAVASYLSADRAFIPSAAPTITLGQVRTRVKSGARLRFAGQVANAIPGYPALAKKRVLLKLVTGTGKHRKYRTVAKSRTNKNGNFAIRYRVRQTGRYFIQVQPTTKVEISTLSPVFGDIQQAGFSHKLSVRVR